MNVLAAITAEDQIDSEVRAVASMLYLLDDQEALDLFRIIEHRRSRPSAAHRRYKQLGLILELIASTGELPASPRYDLAHEAAVQRGESWPDRATLEHAYGSFDKARSAAIHLMHQGGASRVPSNYHHATRRPANGTYQPDPEDPRGPMRIVADALVAFRAHNACWPDGLQEYLDWAEIRRGDARVTGQPPPNYPGRKELLRIFPDWDSALSFAKAATPE